MGEDGLVLTLGGVVPLACGMDGTWPTKPPAEPLLFLKLI